MYKDMEKDGSGIILPSDPSALLERFDLLVASKQAGNTGVQNEIVSILDELLRQKIIDRNLLHINIPLLLSSSLPPRNLG